MMNDAKPQGYSLAEILDPSRITRFSVSCEPTPEELEAVDKLLMNLGIRTCDAKSLEEYDRALGGLLNGASMDGDDAMASTFMLDSLGPLTDKNNVKKK
jgi:hypothetical protein